MFLLNFLFIKNPLKIYHSLHKNVKHFLTTELDAFFNIDNKAYQMTK